MKRLLGLALFFGVALMAWLFMGSKVSGTKKADASNSFFQGAGNVAAEAVNSVVKSDPNVSAIERSVASADLARDYEKFMDLSKSDPVYAYAFALKLNECRNVGGMLDAADDLGRTANGAEASPEAALLTAEGVLERCKGLTDEQTGQYVDLIDFAARSGVVEAQLAFSTVVANSMTLQDAIVEPGKLIDYKRKSIEYLNRAASSGNIDALLQLGFAYEDGILTEKNPEQAYAYLYAYSLSRPGGRISSLLSNAASGLSASQQSVAQTRGNSLYSECCRAD